MGVDMDFMTVYGIKIEPNEESFMEAYHAAEEKDEFGVPEITYDGMSGEYLIFGPVLYKFRADGYDDSTPDFDGTSVSSLQSMEASYRIKFKKYFPDYVHLIKNVPFKVISFVHYT
mgnify:CR=1 FL=1